jgi:predicted PurR-regulated permease PerM
VLLGVLGGILAFGFVGVFLGPVLLAVGFNLVRSWTESRESAAVPPA